MSLALPSESQICAAVGSLKSRPGEFQRLVEGYVRLADPHRYRDLVPQGRRPDDVTVRGWPDAYVTRPCGAIDAVEMTHSDRWETHLRDDLAEVEKATLASFQFVAWAGAPPLAKLSAWLKRIEKAGVPKAEIRLVFRQQLVTELRKPRYAQLWRDPLGLPLSTRPFQWYQDAGLFGSDDQLKAFRPSLQEYTHGHVHRPAIASQVKERLAVHGWALIRGQGASGKTVLATTLALDREQYESAYYLDLSNWNETEIRYAEEVLFTCADKKVLFVVDNVHLSPDAAIALFNSWRSARNGSQLLLLGRLTTSMPRAGQVPPLEQFEHIKLRVEPEDLAGVIRRMMRRMSLEPPNPQPEILAEWMRTFGGELVAFSAAVAVRAQHLAKSEYDLLAEHAVDYVRTYLLDNIGLDELSVLRSLVVLSELEMSASATALARVPSYSLNHGLVLRSKHDSSGYERFHFVHPGIGDLLRKAMVDIADSDKLTVMLEMTAKDSFLGMQLVARLRTAGRDNEAHKLLKEIASSKTWFSSSFGLQYYKQTRRHFSSLKVSTACIDRELPTHAEFLAHALDTPLGDLVAFLRYAREAGSGLANVHEAVVEHLDKNPRALADRALDTPLGDLVVFLRYAREAGSGLANVHEAVVEHLDKNPRALADRALDTPLHFLVAFLRYAREAGSGLGNVHKAVVEHLDKNPRALADRALGKPLGSLAAFLRYAREAGSGLAEVAKAVESQVCVQTLSRAAAEATLNELSGFLSTSWIGANVVAAIDADRWQESRANLDDEPLSTLCAAIVRLVGSGRPTLAVPLALEATALSRLPEWREGYRLHGLGYTVSVLTEEHSCRLHRFLDMLCDGQWPASQMHQASTGSLTGTLFSLWPRLEQSQLKRFECRLGDIAFARRHHRLHNIESIRRGLCLIGTASLFHTRVPDDVAKLYGRKQVAPLICVTQPQSPRVDITGQEVQLWLGLRAISTYLQTSIAVPSTLGEAALKRWRASCPKLQKHTALNEVMIAWLRRCSAVGWNLIADTVPLPE